LTEPQGIGFSFIGRKKSYDPGRTKKTVATEQRVGKSDNPLENGLDANAENDI
jgi:hypothetical protein